MVELSYKTHRVTIDTEGAWVTSYTIAGAPLLYPKTKIMMTDGTEKIRGGCHVCLPNFGPGGNSVHPQHGYGRLMQWQIQSTSLSALELYLAPSPETEQCASQLNYVLDNNGLRMELSVTNMGTELVRLAPGFHPYFSLSGDQAIFLNDKLIHLDKYTEAEFLEAHQLLLRQGTASVQLTAAGMTSWALWTDQLAPYFCVEPTVAGFAFESDATTDQLLASGDTKRYQMTINSD